MKRLTHLLAGLALATTSSAVLAGIQIDPNGGGNPGSSVFIPGAIDNRASSMVTKGCMPPGTALAPRRCAIYAQAFSSNPVAGVGRLVWQAILPVESVGVLGGFGVRLTNDTTAPVVAAQFALYLDTLGTFGTNANLRSGAGFGNLGGDTAAAGLVEIARGIPTIVPTPANPQGSMQITDTAGGSLASKLADNNTGPGTNFTAVDTLDTLSSLSINIDVTTQDRDWITNELVLADILLNIDAFIDNAGVRTPYNLNIIPSQQVVGQRADFDGNGLGGTQAGEDNDFVCVAAPCDMQFQLNPTIEFNGSRVPEPASVALLGLGLSALGFGAVRRRRARQAA